MRILVTGGAGFIGSHVVERLLLSGDSVVVVDDLSTGCVANLADVEGHADLEFVRDSILRPGLLERVSHDVDLIVHLAASVGVARVLARPKDALRRNVDGTLCVLDAAANSNARVLFASSSEVYGLAPRVPALESDPLLVGLDAAPRWGYARSKLFGECVLRDARNAGRVDALSVRLFNTVGPRQVGEHGMVLPRFVRAALKGEALIVHGDGLQRRAFGHVGDVADALVEITRVPLFAELGFHALNLGGTEESTMLDLAQSVIRLTSSQSTIEHQVLTDQMGCAVPETPRRVPDLRLVERLLSTSQRRGLGKILNDVIRFQREVAGSRDCESPLSMVTH